MTVSYNLGFQPKFYLVDNSGKPTAGFMYTYDSLNPTVYKPVYQNANNTNPYPNPVPFAMNGTAGPIYFSYDTDHPDNLYYLRFYDANNNFLYDIQNYNPSTGGGGGSVTNNIDLNNYIVNSVFLHNIPASNVPNNTIICPSAHSDLIDGDIRFFNTNPGVVDSISFPTFIPGLNPFIPDFTPNYYLRYQSSIGVGEVDKYIQIPINPKVDTLDGEVMTVTFWAQAQGGGSNILNVFLKQYFGSGSGASLPVLTQIGTPNILLNTSWTKYVFTFTIPSVAGKTLASEGDDATYLQFHYPTNSATVMDIAVPYIFSGDLAPEGYFESQEQIEAWLDTDRTGDTKFGMSYALNVPGGWIAMGDATIGNSSSNATRSNVDTWFLFYTIWNTTTNTECQLFNSAGSTVSRGGSAQSDWEANNKISLPYNVGSVISNIGNGHLTGESGGSDTHTLTINEMPSHNHPGTTQNHAPGTLGGANSINSNQGSGIGTQLGNINVASQGGGQPHNIVQPTTYIPGIMKL